MSIYLVTGAAGFIGSAVAERLIQLNHSVVTIDNLSTGIANKIPERCEFINGNIQDQSTIDKLRARKFDAIIHIAGQSSGEVSFEDPVYDLQTNVQSTLLLLEYAKNNRCENFIYASTMSIYGDQDNPYVTEESPIYPKSFYSVGKKASENYMRIYSDFGIKCTALRLFNVYGIGQNMSNMKQGMLSIFITMAIKDKRISVKGSKERYRDFVYIEDVVDAFIKSLSRNNGNNFEIYNISTGFKQTVEYLIQKINEHIPYKLETVFTAGTLGDQFGIYGCNNKAQEHLNWKPKIMFEEGIERMIKWALNIYS